MEPTFYDVLGVLVSADRATMEAAYLARLRQVVQGSPPAQVAISVAALAQAYAVLTGTGRRVAYDHALTRLAELTEGYQANVRLMLTLDEARMGTTRRVSFHRPNGQPYEIAVAVPPGSRSGDIVRVPGAGGPSLDGTRRGDLVVELVLAEADVRDQR